MRHYHIHTGYHHIHLHDGWEESAHPRGQPENAGQFVEKESGSAGTLPDWIQKNISQSGLSGPVAGKAGERESWSGELVARGAKLDAVSSMQKLFDQHRWGGELQELGDRQLAEAANQDTDLGKALRLQMELEDQIFHHYEANKSKKVDEREEDAKREMEWNWKNGLGNTDAYENMEQQWNTEEAYKYEQAREPMRFYRKGGLDKPIVATSTNSEGAQSFSLPGSTSHQPHFEPTSNFSYGDMKKAGYSILGGLGFNQMGYSGESEITWIKHANT